MAAPVSTRGNGEERRLRRAVAREADRLAQAERERAGLIAQTVYLGSLALIFVLPVLAGAYLGHWLDTLAAGYSVRWTVGLLLAGLGVGAVNVWLFLRGRP